MSDEQTPRPQKRDEDFESSSGLIAADCRTVLRTRYLFPVDGPPIADGAVLFDGPTTVAVGQFPLAGKISDATVLDLGSAAILPGLVNSHTHLEFSELAKPLGEPGLPFADWIRAVVAYRRSRTDAEGQQAIALGLDESRRAGVTALGEISTSDWPASLNDLASIARSPHVTGFHELLGLSADRAATSRASTEQFLKSSAALPGSVGLSPHAPYTVRPELLRYAVAQSAARGFPLAMHVAESPEEMELLRSGSGPLRKLLEEFAAWDPTAFVHPARPLDYLKTLAQAARALIIHGTYLDDDEIAFLGASAARMSVVYCPRTHARFKMAPYPLAKLLAAGATVALGTDSRASNPDLNLFAEMRFIATHYPIDPQDVLRMATSNGAKALGLNASDRSADFTIVSLPQIEAEPFELLFDPGSKAIATIRAGRVIAGAFLKLRFS
jgi:cytosine/adenosine deaminase-related metal-dependent hydrolase